MCSAKKKVLAIKSQLRAKFLANVGCAATDTFYARQKQKKTLADMREQLLDCTRKYAEEIGEAKDHTALTECGGWIDFRPKPQEAADDAAETPKEEIAAPVIIKFNEKTGEQLTSQATFQK